MSMSGVRAVGPSGTSAAELWQGRAGAHREPAVAAEERTRGVCAGPSADTFLLSVRHLFCSPLPCSLNMGFGCPGKTGGHASGQSAFRSRLLRQDVWVRQRNVVK